VNAFDRGSDSPDRDTPTEVPAADNSAWPVKAHLLVDTRSRSEAHADLKQSVESGWDGRRVFDAPRAELARFTAGQANLAEVTPAEADRYVEQNRPGRPWLAMVERASPEARWIIAAMDQGDGHGHIRHEGWVTEDANMRRVAYLEDPAQLDASKRLQGIDGLKPNDRTHFCAPYSTRITDPDAFATAFVRGVEHSAVQDALRTPYDPSRRPGTIEVPIADLLGENGHKFCTGWRLDPGEGSMNEARSNRHSWRAAQADGRQPDSPKPSVEPVRTFEGGAIVFAISHNRERTGYSIVSMYPQPAPNRPPSATRTTA
jgi:hypothetical protein